MAKAIAGRRPIILFSGRTRKFLRSTGRDSGASAPSVAAATRERGTDGPDVGGGTQRRRKTGAEARTGRLSSVIFEVRTIVSLTCNALTAITGGNNALLDTTRDLCMKGNPEN